MPKTLNSGGLAVIRPAPLIAVPKGQAGITLMSDLHIGAANVDYAAIQADLKAAARHEDRILLGGDIFDFILPNDKKRYQPGTLHERLQGRNDIVNEAVEWAVELLKPYADRIDAIGTGNHETCVEKIHSFDAIRLLCERLSTDERKIPQAGYTGFFDYRLVREAGGRPLSRYVVWYAHGSGSARSASTALAKVIGASQSFAADLYWSGHHHVRAHCTEVMIHADRASPVPVTRDVKCVVTGSYMVPYGYQSQEDARRKGRKTNYAAESGMRPGAIGGARVVLKWGREIGFPGRVEVVQ